MTLDKNSLETAHAAVTHDPEVNISIYGAEAIIETYLAALPASEPMGWTSQSNIDGLRNHDSFVIGSIVNKPNDSMCIPVFLASPAPSEPVSDGLVRFDGVTMTPAAAANRLAESAAALTAAEAKIAELEHRSLAEGWRPIETAPKRGTYLVYQPVHRAGRDALAARVCLNDQTGYVRQSTHWMPLPQPPEAK